MMPTHRIEIFKETKQHRLALKLLNEVTREIIGVLALKEVNLTVLLVSDQRIRALNKKYLKHNWATDIITFDYGSNKRKKMVEGDLVISLDTAKRQAKEYGNSFFYEVAFYVCHGILHLLGEKDDTDPSRKRMLGKQTRILKKIKKCSL